MSSFQKQRSRQHHKDADGHIQEVVPFYQSMGESQMASETKDPSREEIKKMCEKIRVGWNEREHWVRRGYTDGRPVLTVTRVRSRYDGKVL
jgi:hypothetical protein